MFLCDKIRRKRSHIFIDSKITIEYTLVIFNHIKQGQTNHKRLKTVF